MKINKKKKNLGNQRKRKELDLDDLLYFELKGFEMTPNLHHI